MALTDITPTEVEKAIEECDHLGRDAFLRHYGFARARRYLLSHGGKQYDSKAIVGAAHGFLPGQRPLAAKDFSGGAEHAARFLRGLGFNVADKAEETAESAEPALAPTALIDRVATLKVNRASGLPALYQPIALLWAIGRARRGEPRLTPWTETEQAIAALLKRHGVRGERPRPDYPVAALHRAGLWTVRGHTGPVPTAHGDARLRNWFSDNQPLSGLTESAYELLRRSGETRLAVIGELLCTFFEELDHVPLLTDVGLYDDEVGDGIDVPDESWLVSAARYERWCRMAERTETRDHGRRVTRTVHDPVRSAFARKAVLDRSEGRCENPNCTGQPTDVTDARQPLLEVDHVLDLALGGRDHPSQMVALCPNCHAVKTRGRTRETLRELLLKVALERHSGVRQPQREPESRVTGAALPRSPGR